MSDKTTPMKKGINPSLQQHQRYLVNQLNKEHNMSESIEDMVRWFNIRNYAGFYMQWVRSGYLKTYEPCLKYHKDKEVTNSLMGQFTLSIRGEGARSIVKYNVHDCFAVGIYANSEDVVSYHKDVCSTDLDDAMNYQNKIVGDHTWKRINTSWKEREDDDLKWFYNNGGFVVAAVILLIAVFTVVTCNK